VLAVAAATPRLRELGTARVARRMLEAARRVQARLSPKGAPEPAARRGPAARAAGRAKERASRPPAGAQRAERA